MIIVMKLVIIAALTILLCWLTNLAVLKTQTSRYENYWIKISKQAEGEDKIYIALGDSAAQGIGASKPQYGYVGLISKKLNTKSNYHVINLSSSGAKLDDVLNTQLPLLSKMTIDADTVITVEIGANDMADFDEAIFRKQYSELLQKLPKQAIISDIPYFGAGLFRTREPNAVKATNIIHELAKSSGHRVARLHDYTSQNKNLTYFAADYFHPNNKAYVSWFKAFDEHLAE